MFTFLRTNLHKTSRTTCVVMSTLALLVTINASANTKANSDEPDIYVSDNEYNRISVAWVSPKEFTDVKESNFSSKKYRKYVFNQLEKHLDELSRDLPEGQNIRFEVTNLDLAGRIEFANMLGFGTGVQDVRVMRDIDIPRIKFSYQLKDNNGEIISADEVNLKDMSYLRNASTLRRDRPFYYEKKMLSRWFKKQLLEKTS